MAAQRPVDIIFSYSTNGGASWTSQTLQCADHRVALETTIDVEHVLQSDRQVVQFTTTRMIVDLTVDERNFLPKADPNELKWQFIQRWIGAPLKRISSNGVTLWGFTEFNATSNTAYVVLREAADPDVPDSDRRKFILPLKVAKRYVIT